jgi:predicted aminopeptidase
VRNLLKVLKRILILLFILSGIWGACNLSLVIYGINQFEGQMHIVSNARPIEKVLQDKNISDTIKSGLQFIEQVKKFAVDSLLLERSENYTTFYDQMHKPLLWVLTASEPFKIKAFTWKFPLLGRVSYKGFFIMMPAWTKQIT